MMTLEEWGKNMVSGETYRRYLETYSASNIVLYDMIKLYPNWRVRVKRFIARFFFVALIIGTTSAHSQDYNSGYNDGYYSGTLVSNVGGQYGSGVEDGNYDAYQEDYMAAQGRDDSAVKDRQQSEDQVMQEMLATSRRGLYGDR